MSAEVLNNDDINNLVKNKEDEIKHIYNNRINQLEKLISDKDTHIKTIEDKLTKNEKDFQYNLNLLKEQDDDLRTFHKNIDSFVLLLKEKDNEITHLKGTVNDLAVKLQSEKGRKENEIEMYKYKLNQQVLQSKDELKALNKLLAAKDKEIEELKVNHARALEDERRRMEDDLGKLKEDIISKSNLISQREALEKEFREKEIFLNKKVEDITNNFNKVNNENLTLIREKMQLETKIKILETSEGESKSSSYFINEKNKYLLKGNEELKLELTNRNYKIDNLNKLIEELNIEIHGLKQKISFKEFEIEKKNLTEKNLNERLKDLTQTGDKLVADKKVYMKELEEERLKNSSLEHKQRLIGDEKEYLQQRQSEEVRKLCEDIKKLNEVNFNLKKELEEVEVRKKDTSTGGIEKPSQVDDYFMKNDTMNFINMKDRNTKDYDRLLKEKDEEVSSLNKQIQGHREIIASAEKHLNEHAITIGRLQNENEKFKQEKLKLEIELRNINNRSCIDETEVHRLKEQLVDYNKQLQKLKLEFDEKALDSIRLKDTLNQKINELLKVKKERDKLAVISNNLRAEVNSLENLLHQRDCQNDYEPYYEEQYIDYYSGMDIQHEDLRKKKENILNNSIKVEAKKHINNILNGDERSKSNGIRQNLRKLQVDNVNKSRSPSTSLSPKRYEQNDLKDLITVTKLNYDSNSYVNHPDEKIYEDLPYVSVGQVKLLKRNKSKPKYV
jgi:chromosome segregation ATPase